MTKVSDFLNGQNKSNMFTVKRTVFSGVKNLFLVIDFFTFPLRAPSSGAQPRLIAPEIQSHVIKIMREAVKL